MVDNPNSEDGVKVRQQTCKVDNKANISIYFLEAKLLVWHNTRCKYDVMSTDKDEKGQH